jgi:hypothetical protein
LIRQQRQKKNLCFFIGHFFGLAHDPVRVFPNDNKHDQSPSKPEKPTIANPPIVVIANDKNMGPMFKANPSAPIANKTTPNAQINPIKILLNMINPQSIFIMPIGGGIQLLTKTIEPTTALTFDVMPAIV